MNSLLNPEAPEFHPHIASFTQVAYKSVHKTVQSSNLFPAKASYDFFKTFTDFNVVTCQLTENVVDKSNKIIVTEIPTVKLKKKDVKYNTEIIVDTNDRVLDRVEIYMDSLNKGSTVSDQHVAKLKASPSVSSWNYNPDITTVQMGSTTFLGAKNIPRPQLTFKDRIDNTDSLWVPKISDKPNNIKPLVLKIIYNDRGEAVGYEHPYKVELSMYQPPPEFLVPDAEAPSFPLPMDKTKFTYIDTESQMNELVKHLSTVKEIAVDVEQHSYRSYQGITCLIQISTDEGGDFIIDALAVREHIHKLNFSFTDPGKIKVFHGADMDVLWLQRDFGVYIVGLFDTFRAARYLQMSGLGLKNLLKHYCNVDADKKYQLADWRIRPLPDELVEYARQDTHYLLYVWRRMKADLLATVNGVNLLRSVFGRCKIICGATYHKTVIDETSHMPLYLRSKRAFNSRQLAAFKMLFRWRDAQARLLDESVTYLIPNHMMLALAEALPREVQGLNACCNPMPPFVKQNLIHIHRMLLSCRELPLESISQSTASTSETCLVPPPVSYDVHDMAGHDDSFSLVRDDDLNLEESNELLKEENEPNELNNGEMQMPTINPEEGKSKKVEFVSTLNVDAEMYVPPYLRYRGYLLLGKDEENKNTESKESNVVTLGSSTSAFAEGDQLTKPEVLLKWQHSMNIKENEQIKQNEQVTEGEDLIKDSEDSEHKKGAQRKRKMSTEKANKNVTNAQENESVNKPGSTSNNNNDIKLKARDDSQGNKPFYYKNVNYMKYHHDHDVSRKETKMKFKKQK